MQNFKSSHDSRCPKNIKITAKSNVQERKASQIKRQMYKYKKEKSVRRTEPHTQVVRD